MYIPGPHPKPARAPERRKGFNSLLAVPETPMRKVSKTNSRAVAKSEHYYPARERFLRAHPYCEMRITSPNICQGEATEIQHMIQVSLDPSVENLLDETHWLAACHACNSWAGIHPQEAIALGVEMTPAMRDAEADR